jgi:hypothetical protein
MFVKETGPEAIYHRIDIASDAARDAEVRHLGNVIGSVQAVTKALRRRLISAGQRLHIVHEAGSLRLRAATQPQHTGPALLRCGVVAPSSMPAGSTDRLR